MNIYFSLPDAIKFPDIFTQLVFSVIIPLGFTICGIIDKGSTHNCGNESFPKNVGRHCAGCDYLEACREDRDFKISRPEKLLTARGRKKAKNVKNNVVIATNKQLRLKLKFERVKRDSLPKKEAPIEADPKIILRSLPWNDDSQK